MNLVIIVALVVIVISFGMFCMSIVAMNNGDADVSKTAINRISDVTQNVASKMMNPLKKVVDEDDENEED